MLVSGSAGLLKPSLVRSFQAVVPFPGSCCLSAVLPPLLLDHRQGPELCLELVVIAAGHQWCLSQGAGTNMQSSLRLTKISSLP